MEINIGQSISNPFERDKQGTKVDLGPFERDPLKTKIDIGHKATPAGIKPLGRIELDPTLTKSGYAADAAATGSAIRQVSAGVDDLRNELHENYYTKRDINDIIESIDVIDGCAKW